LIRIIFEKINKQIPKENKLLACQSEKLLETNILYDEKQN
jgi:hypothetical protein